MSESRQEETRASEQNAEEGCLALPSAPQFVAGHLEDLEDALLCSEPRPIHQIQDWKGNGSDYADDPPASRRQAVYCVGLGRERRVPPSAWHLHRMRRMRRHSCQLCEDHRELGGQREWDATPEGPDPRAFVPGSEFADGAAAAGSGDEESRGAEGLSEGAGLAPPSSPQFVAGEMEDLEDALRIPEHPPDCLMCQRRRCCWPERVEEELWPIFINYPDLGPYKWSWGKPGATFPFLQQLPNAPSGADSRA